MAKVTHTTPADGTFSAAGALAWDADHALENVASSGANSDITSLTGVTGGISTPDYVTFDTTPETIPTAAGSLYWDSTNGIKTLNLIMDGGDVIQQIGEEQYYRVRASADITNGQVVMFTGTVGGSGVLKAAPATGLTAETSLYVMGIATQDIATNSFGYITSFGLVRDIDTRGGAENWVDGQLLYLNPTVAGGLTKYPPTAPNPKVQVCAVINAANVGAGSLFVRPTFGGALGQFEGDVQVTTPSSGQVLMYDGNYWYNSASIGGGNF